MCIYVWLDCVNVIGLTREPHQAFIVQVYLQRFEARDQNINSKIELQTINQQGIVDVLTDDQGLIQWHFRYVIYHKDAFALGASLRLKNP